MTSKLRRLAIAACVAGSIALVGTAIGYLEYRSNVVARHLGDYLADVNDTRASHGRLWDLISSEEQARSAIPDTTADLALPSNLPQLVRGHRLTVDRIPDEGTPGYLAIQAHPVPESAAGSVDAGRLVEATHLHRLGKAILGSADYERTPFTESARARALEMSRELSSADSTADDSTAASVIETFTAVLIDQHVEALSREVLTAWDEGRIEQIFLNRSLGDYRGEIHFSDPESPGLVFTLSLEHVTQIFGPSPDTAAP